jgi:uncharacterized membrane protein HdeD (DUF308 family)
MSGTVSPGPAQPVTLRPADDRKTERLLWWLAVAGAATSVILGILMVVWPEATLFLSAVLFGLWLMVHGIVYVVQAVTRTAEDAGMRALHGVLGVIFIALGIICLRHVLLTLLAIATVIGLTWFIGGIVQLVSAFGRRYTGLTRVGIGVLGGLTVAGGLIILFWPKLTLFAMVIFTGVWLILTGIVQLVMVLRLRSELAAG